MNPHPYLVSDVMTKKVVAVTQGAGFKEIVDAMARWKVSALPVLEGEGRVIGVVSEADLLPKEEFRVRSPGLVEQMRRLEDTAKAGSLCAGDLMTRPAVTVAPDATLPQAARLMAAHHVKRLPVVGDGTLKGIVSRADLLKVFLRPDTELAEEIRHQVVERLFPLSARNVRVEVADGVVTLSGEIRDSALVPVAARLARAVEGVVDVRIELTAPGRGAPGAPASPRSASPARRSADPPPSSSWTLRAARPFSWSGAAARVAPSAPTSAMSRMPRSITAPRRSPSFPTSERTGHGHYGCTAKAGGISRSSRPVGKTEPMTDIVFTRRSGWIPNVIREGGELRLMLGAGADANHEPRTFTFPIGEAHLAVIRADLPRHLLLWSAVLPLCDAAGTRGRLDENAAVALLDTVLLSAPADVDALFRRIRWDRGRLIAHGADIDLLDRGQVCAAMRAATETSDGQRAQKYHAERRRAERGTVLGPLDAAILSYTGQYLHGATVPKRLPDAVDPALLPEVMRVIATAEQACAGIRIGRDPRRGKRATDKRDWDRMATTVDAAVRRAHPELVDDAVRTVSFLMCSEAANRSRNTPMDDHQEADGKGARKRPLSFTDDKGAEVKWLPDNPRSATAEFWEFVGDRSAADNEVFTIEDEELGEGIQLHFYADSIARITTVNEGEGGSDPEHRVEYSLVDGISGYRDLVSAFVRGGCAALEQYGPWMSDTAEFERARRRRDAK